MGENRIQTAVNWIVDILVMIVLACYTVYAFGCCVSVNGHSMEPALSQGDYVLVNRLAYDLGQPDRFDIVVFTQDGSVQNIKRVIGLPGETVQIKDRAVYINGERLEADGDLGNVSIAGAAEHPVELGENEYFLLGDNRDSSEDSRFFGIGNVKREQIIGKVWLRFRSVSDFGLVSS